VPTPGRWQHPGVAMDDFKHPALEIMICPAKDYLDHYLDAGVEFALKGARQCLTARKSLS
jgi:hypothetical protein